MVRGGSSASPRRQRPGGGAVFLCGQRSPHPRARTQPAQKQRAPHTHKHSLSRHTRATRSVNSLCLAHTPPSNMASTDAIVLPSLAVLDAIEAAFDAQKAAAMGRHSAGQAAAVNAALTQIKAGVMGQLRARCVTLEAPPEPVDIALAARVIELQDELTKKAAEVAALRAKVRAVECVRTWPTAARGGTNHVTLPARPPASLSAAAVPRPAARRCVRPAAQAHGLAQCADGGGRRPLCLVVGGGLVGRQGQRT